MGTLLSIIVLGIRVFISITALLILAKCYLYPDEFPIDGLKWYVCFFIFDMWFMKVNALHYEPKVEEKKEEKED